VKIYAASPLGFSEVGRDFYDGKFLPLLRSLGHDVLDPWVLTPQTKIDAVTGMPYGPQRRDAWRALDAEIGRNNFEALRSANAVVAVLDGVDVDSGTASEIGCAFALGKGILGYRGDFRLAGDNDGATINLQVEYFIEASGGSIVHALADIPAGLECLVKARKTT
jgi:nucleoside 2-deoxyribosyltransferase